MARSLLQLHKLLTYFAGKSEHLLEFLMEGKVIPSLPKHNISCALFVSPDQGISGDYCALTLSSGSTKVFRLFTAPDYKVGEFALNMTTRTDLQITLASAKLRPISATDLPFAEECTLSIKKQGDPSAATLDMDIVTYEIVRQLTGYPLIKNLRYVVTINGSVYFVIPVRVDGGVRMSSKTAVEIVPADASIRMGGVGASQVTFNGNFNFKDMGIGGLDDEFAVIFRRAFVSRLMTPKIVKELGIKHVKGILLYGPPGTGKTLIARKIGEKLNCAQSEPVSGPSLLSKYVGESEANVRKLFEPAIADPSKLHLIICDEFDALCKKRGMRTDSTGVADNVVNQLLSMIDGPKQLDNILLICMTNRKELLDEAIMRPGRLEIQIEIKLPDEKGRKDIFEIHTKVMKNTGHMAADVDLALLAHRCKNYTGAEIESVVKSATSIAMSRVVDPSDPKKIGTTPIVLTKHDFELALADIKPMFGTNSSDVEIVTATPFLKWSAHVVDIHNDMLTRIKELKPGNLCNLMVSGRPRIGKTKLVCDVATQSGIECIKYVKAEDLITTSDHGMAIYEIFDKCCKTDESIVILDGFEYLIEHSPLGNIYNNKTLQVIYSMLNKLVSRGKRLVIVLVTADPVLVSSLGISDLMDKDYNLENTFLNVEECKFFDDLGVETYETDTPTVLFSRLKTKGI